MLIELHIQNFAIIQSLTLSLKSGLSVFTGETGAGKSIILDALEAVLGGRADTTSIRTGADVALIEASFVLSGGVKDRVSTLLEAEGLLEDPGYLSLSREIRKEGRNTARINGRSVSASLQRELGALLVDIHGQSEHLSLLKVRHHLELLDRFAATQELLADYRLHYQRLRAVQGELESLRQSEIDAERRKDVLDYQIREIEAAHLQDNEEESLRQERTRLSNAENLSMLAQQSLLLLDENTSESASVTDLLGQVVNALSELTRIDQNTKHLSEQAEVSLSNLSDLALELRDYAESIEFNPQRLDQIEERIDLINRLKRKYGGSLESIIAFQAQALQDLEKIESAGEQIQKLNVIEQELMEVLAEKALLISNQRKAASLIIANNIETQLDELKMTHARFVVDMKMHEHPAGLKISDDLRVDFDASGIDQVEFLVETNPGEGLKPLVKIASGGEVSRFMLALKNVLALADTIPTLVFDEIDQGIGGRIGLMVGEKLWRLSNNHQVLCVTHLPQLAAYGDQHFNVTKLVHDHRTQTEIFELTGETRQNELASMLGPTNQSTLNAANELLESVSQSKGKIKLQG